MKAISGKILAVLLFSADFTQRAIAQYVSGCTDECACCKANVCYYREEVCEKQENYNAQLLFYACAISMVCCLSSCVCFIGIRPKIQNYLLMKKLEKNGIKIAEGVIQDEENDPKGLPPISIRSASLPPIPHSEEELEPMPSIQGTPSDLEKAKTQNESARIEPQPEIMKENPDEPEEHQGEVGICFGESHQFISISSSKSIDQSGTEEPSVYYMDESKAEINDGNHNSSENLHSFAF